MMHAQNFLHRDIAPDNIIVRPDGTPVLLDFGTARRAVAEMSRALTGIVKAGYSPQEQYAADSRLQGPWSDLYAFGGTLYRAVTGKPPEESTLRFDRRPHGAGGEGRRRAAIGRAFLRPSTPASRSGTRRAPALGGAAAADAARRRASSRTAATERQAERRRATALIDAAQSVPVAATVGQSASVGRSSPPSSSCCCGVVGGLAYTRWQSGERDRLAGPRPSPAPGEPSRAADEQARLEAEAKRKAEEAQQSTQGEAGDWTRSRSAPRRRSATSRRASAICPAAA